MNKEKITAILKSKVFVGVVCFILGGSIFSDGSKVQELQGELDSKVAKITELEAKIETAKPWFAMKEEERKAEEEKIAKAEAEKKAEEEKKQKEEEAKKANRIGERVIYTYGSKGQAALTINSVVLTDERNQFADPVKKVVEINYTIENIDMDELDFFLDNKAKFYDADGNKCNSYPNSTGAGTYDISKGRKATGKEFIGITNSDKAYLEMELGGNIYKWSL